MRSVNIWASIVHITDHHFAGFNSSKSADLSLQINEFMSAATQGRQIWMTNISSFDPGCTSILQRHSYRLLSNSPESYLVLMTPGFSDLLKKVPIEIVSRQTEQIFSYAQAFNKRVVICVLGVPPGCPKQVTESLMEINKIYRDLIRKYGGVSADLQDLEYEPWAKKGSCPSDMKKAAHKISDAILQCHSGFDEWKKIYAAKK